MAFKISTGLRNALMGDADTITAITLKAVEDTGTFTIEDSGDGLFDAGFRPEDTITISGFTGTTANNQITTITSIESDGSEMEIAGTLVDDDAGESVTITANSKGFKDIFNNAVIRVYSGAVPATADADEGSGTCLLEITKDGGTLTPGTSTNGLNFDAIASGVLSKNTDTWSDAGIAAGVAAWWRLYDNGRVTGLSTTSKRCQGLVGTSGVAMILSSTTVALGATVTCDTADFTMPAS